MNTGAHVAAYLAHRRHENVSPLVAAWKRAEHFGAGIADGPFTPLHSAVGSNYCRMVDAEPDSSAEQLQMFNQWAQALNRLADGCKVSDRLDLREAFASFGSRLWINPVSLMT